MASVDVGYCTLEDVREVLQELDLTGPVGPGFVEGAILGESEWIQEDTNRHWFDASGIEDDDDNLVATEPLIHEFDEQDIPSSPHSDNVQTFRGGKTRGTARYPVRHAGPYTRVPLTRRDVRELTKLLVRNQDGSVTDWINDDRREEGRGEDYYVQVNDSTGQSYLYLHTGSLPRLSDYGSAVTVSYEYGVDEVPKTLRTATACLAAAHLLRDDEGAVGIPDSGQLIPVETKADKAYDRGLRLLEIHR